MSYTTTDKDLLNQVLATLLEPYTNATSVPSGLWSISELVTYMNDRQHRLLRETLMTAEEALVPWSAAIERGALPSDWIATHHASWEQASHVITALVRTDHTSLDYAAASWLVDRGQDPIVYSEDLVPQAQIMVSPTPRTSGVLHVIYTPLSTTLDGTGTLLSVPDEFATSLKWGVLADALRKAGPAQDLTRAAYADARFQEAIALGQWLMNDLATNDV